MLISLSASVASVYFDVIVREVACEHSVRVFAFVKNQTDIDVVCLHKLQPLHLRCSRRQLRPCRPQDRRDSSQPYWDQTLRRVSKGSQNTSPVGVLSEKIAVLQRGDFATALTISLASASEAAPVTSTSMNFDAPSPSEAIIFARSSDNDVSASPKRSASSVPAVKKPH